MIKKLQSKIRTIKGEYQKQNQKLKKKLRDQRKTFKMLPRNSQLENEGDLLKNDDVESDTSTTKHDHLIRAIQSMSVEEEDKILNAVHGTHEEEVDLFPFPLTCPNHTDAANILKSTNSSVIFGYHVGMMNNWRDVVRDQMRTLHRCGLGQLISKMFITYSNNETVDEELTDLKSILSRYKFADNAIIEHNSIQPIEGAAITALHHECVNRVGMQPYPPVLKDENITQTEKTVAFYIHTKGTSRFNIRGGEWGSYDKILAWRKYMEYFLIERPKLCIDKIINQGKFTCGSQFHVTVHHYSGNFWSADCDYLASIKPLAMNESRHKAEDWIGLQLFKDGILPSYYHRFVSVHDPGIDLYQSFVHPANYSDYNLRWEEWFEKIEPR